MINVNDNNVNANCFNVKNSPNNHQLNHNILLIPQQYKTVTLIKYIIAQAYILLKGELTHQLVKKHMYKLKLILI